MHSLNKLWIGICTCVNGEVVDTYGTEHFVCFSFTFSTGGIDITPLRWYNLSTHRLARSDEWLILELKISTLMRKLHVQNSVLFLMKRKREKFADHYINKYASNFFALKWMYCTRRFRFSSSSIVWSSCGWFSIPRSRGKKNEENALREVWDVPLC